MFVNPAVFDTAESSSKEEEEEEEEEESEKVQWGWLCSTHLAWLSGSTVDPAKHCEHTQPMHAQLGPFGSRDGLAVHTTFRLFGFKGDLSLAADMMCHWLPVYVLLQEDDLPAYARKKGRFHKGSCVGLHAWVIARLVEVKQPAGSGKQRGKFGAAADAVPAGAPSRVLLQRYYRPEDVDKDTGYRWANCCVFVGFKVLLSITCMGCMWSSWYPVRDR